MPKKIKKGHSSYILFLLHLVSHIWTVSYNILSKGFIDDNLPEMNEGRFYHGCGSYYSGGTKVSVVVVVVLCLTLVQVILVAGGVPGWGHRYSYLSSTEKLMIGATAWTTANPLPRTLSSMGFIDMQNKIYLFGKYSSVVGGITSNSVYCRWL